MLVQFGDPAFTARGDNRNRNLLPRELEVEAGQTVSFRVSGFHQIAVYMAPEGANRDQVTNNPDQFVNTNTLNAEGDIDDPNGRVALGPSPRSIDTEAVNRDDALGIDVTFQKPGRYLLICAIPSHFLDQDPGANGGMFGFIEVK